MAISRAQLLKELLPGLNELFDIEYKKYGNPLGVEMTEEDKGSVVHIPPQTLLDTWRSVFGDEAARMQVVMQMQENDTLTRIGQWLYSHDYLQLDEVRDVYYTRSTQI